MSNSEYYNYGIKHILFKDSDLIKDINEYENIILCSYSVNTSGKIPFLKYLLINDEYDTLSLPKLPIYSQFNKEGVIPYSLVYLSGILQIINFEEFSINSTFDGFYEFDDNLYLFYDITNCELNIDETYLSSKVRFGLIDEIINHKNICNIPIEYETSLFFIKNQSVTYLHDKQNKPYEIPVVAFVGKPTEQKMNFVLTFGESAKNKSATLGPYFYFTSFNYAIRQGGWSHDYRSDTNYGSVITDDAGKYKKGGIVRFALFVGQTKYIENSPNDPIDESDIKKELLKDDNVNVKKEILTMRISDHDGIWAKTYDSIYLGRLELDDGSYMEDVPMLVLRDYDQQIPLTCHYIDKTTLGEKYEEKNSYYSIM